VAAFWLGLLCACWQGHAAQASIRLIVCLAGLAASWPAIRRDLLLRGPGAVRRILWRPDGQFELDLAGGLKDSARLGPGSLVLGSAVWMDLRGRRRYAVFISRTGVGHHNYSALRRRLRWLRSPDGLPAPGAAMG
jgi:hypothetical protein